MFVIKEGDGGSYAYMVQLALARAGYPLIIDGIFGGRTKAAVIDFQKSRGLAPDGIVGKNTFHRWVFIAIHVNTQNQIGIIFFY